MLPKKLSNYPKTTSNQKQHKTAKEKKDEVSGDTAYPQQSDQYPFSFEQLANKSLAERLDNFLRKEIDNSIGIETLRLL